MMMKQTVLAAVIAIVPFAATARAQGETKVGFKDLPASVQKSAKEQSEGARVRGYSKEVENGKTLYEVQTVKDGKTKDVEIDEAGAVVEVEQQVDVSSLPPAVKAGLEKQAAGSQLGKVESVTKSGAVVSYETTVAKGGKRSEIAVTADGGTMKPD